jgi:hypothetical protein
LLDGWMLLLALFPVLNVCARFLLEWRVSVEADCTVGRLAASSPTVPGREPVVAVSCFLLLSKGSSFRGIPPIKYGLRNGEWGIVRFLAGVPEGSD